MALCPGCGKQFEKFELFEHCFVEHPTMPVQDLHVLARNTKARLDEFQAHKKALADQMKANDAQIAALGGSKK
jgi:hypothetical protein